MNILILGDVMGSSGRKAIKKNLSKIINENEIDFTIINGENAADDGKGITSSIAEEFFLQGVDVITSGNHIWDKKETTDYINKEKRLLRPANLLEDSPGNGYGIYLTVGRYKLILIYSFQPYQKVVCLCNQQAKRFCLPKVPPGSIYCAFRS